MKGTLKWPVCHLSRINFFLDYGFTDITRNSRKYSECLDIHTIMADETADVSNHEQLVICIRWVDDDLVIHEDLIGMHPLKHTTSDHIIFIIKVKLLFCCILVKSLTFSVKANLFTGCTVKTQFEDRERTWSVLRWGSNNGRNQNWRRYTD